MWRIVIYMAIERDFTTTEEWERLLGEQFRRARLLDDLDQVTLAQRANVSVGALKNLESGRGAQLRTAIRVARALGKQDWLGSLEPERGPGPLDLMRLEQELAPPRRASPKKREG
jgi:transcriptional regulator with XRE-family HTH domain